jgi:hypothetical protein
MSDLVTYAKQLVEASGVHFNQGELFAKILTTNDDSGRHGVLIPTDAYNFLPHLAIPDLENNHTEEIDIFDIKRERHTRIAYKYYQRYPERRLTRLSTTINDDKTGSKMMIVVKHRSPQGQVNYVIDYVTQETNRFQELFQLIFGDSISPTPGHFVIRPIEGLAFHPDEALQELLSGFDNIQQMGWIESYRQGDTGVGYTFETLLGISENNDRRADFRGIEIKCKGVRTGKINLFQQAPQWNDRVSARERIRLIGYLDKSGLYSCHSQVTTRRNNRGLSLSIQETGGKIDLLKNSDPIGFWSFSQLEQRLLEKHSRAVFVKASKKDIKGVTQYKYDELLYCDKPTIQKFVDLTLSGNIVFEFLMSEKASGSIRNRGYPWRLLSFELLDSLFSFSIKLR